MEPACRLDRWTWLIDHRIDATYGRRIRPLALLRGSPAQITIPAELQQTNALPSLNYITFRGRLVQETTRLWRSLNLHWDPKVARSPADAQPKDDQVDRERLCLKHMHKAV